MWFCVRARAQQRKAEVPVLAFVLKIFRGPGLDHDVFGFDQPLIGLRRINAVALIVVNVVGGTTTQPHDKTTLADVVDQRHLLRHADRVMQGHLRDREADLNAFGAGRQCSREAHRIDISANTVEMVFRQPQHVHAQFVAELALAQRLVNDLVVLLRLHCGRKQKVAEFH